jgi:hypothetical protein
MKQTIFMHYHRQHRPENLTSDKSIHTANHKNGVKHNEIGI